MQFKKPSQVDTENETSHRSTQQINLKPKNTHNSSLKVKYSNFMLSIYICCLNALTLISEARCPKRLKPEAHISGIQVK